MYHISFAWTFATDDPASEIFLSKLYYIQTSQTTNNKLAIDR
jgi:hypothetical protein